MSRKRSIGLLGQGLGFEIGGLVAERSGWEICFASLGLPVIFLSEGSLGEVEEVVESLLIPLCLPLLR